MKIETKLKKVQAILLTRGFNENEANDAIAETNRCFKLENLTVSYFVEALISTYGINGVAR
jgi:hypothetical protein